jgi:hypothetical protein
MTLSKTLIAAALASLTAVTSASAQLPNWAAQDQILFRRNTRTGMSSTEAR